MKNKKIEFEYIEVSSLDKLEHTEQRLVSKAKSAARKAYAPYSNFFVGSAVLLENGEIFTGSNQENAAFPSGICAERTALFSAATAFPEVPVKAIVVTAIANEKFVKTPVSPCGTCRQVILQTQNRYSKKIKVILFAEEKSYIVEDASYLLPLPFEKF